MPLMISFHHLMSGMSYVKVNKVNNGIEAEAGFDCSIPRRCFKFIGEVFFNEGLAERELQYDFCGFTGSLVIDGHSPVVFEKVLSTIHLR